MANNERDTDDLEALCRTAGESAGGDGPVARVRGDRVIRSTSVRTRWRVAFVGGLGALAFAAAAARWMEAPATGVAAADAASPAPPIDEPVADMPPPMPTPAPTAIAQAPAGPIRWQAGELQVDVDSEPLDQALTQLAQATHTTLTGRNLLQGTERVTMHWYASDAATAWQLMLRDRARFKIHCDSSACEVGIVNPLAPPGATGDAAAGKRGAPRQPTQEEVSQPDGAC